MCLVRNEQIIAKRLKKHLTISKLDHDFFLGVREPRAWRELGLLDEFARRASVIF